MKDEECVPVKVALQLMDTSSLGMARQYPGFQETHHDLQYALQAIVNGTAQDPP
jgi:exocyst complex component 4